MESVTTSKAHAHGTLLLETMASISSDKLEAALKRVSKRAAQYEYQMKDLESKLAESLSNFRAIDGIVQESVNGLKRNSRRANRALNTHVPRIMTELDESLDALSELTETLPTIQSQVADIRTVYDSGQQKAQMLVEDLTWLNTEFYERWRQVIFTTSSPVSWQWKVFFRASFLVSFVLCGWLVWSALLGVASAYKSRQIWGSKLMS